MFTEDFAREYLNQKRIGLKLSHKKDRALEKMNSEVHIRDIVVRSSGFGYGESDIESKDFNSFHNQSTQLRMMDHIGFLFDIANEDHRKNYCNKVSEGGYNIKSDSVNKVTRLTTNEFSFYTQKPLSLGEYQSVIMDIEKKAENLEPNVHVLLSSFSVQDKSGELLNLSIFVEGGKPPVFHTFAKNTSSSVDVDYNKSIKPFSQQERAASPTFHANLIASEDSQAISTGSVFEVKSQGGARYTQCIDICLDHALAHSKNLNMRRIIGDADPDEIFPSQIEQCVSSNWIDLYSDNNLSDRVLHADPVRSMVKDYGAAVQKSLTEGELKKLIPESATEMEVTETNYGFQIEDPGFGTDFVVEVLKERPAGKYKEEFKNAVNEHNSQAVDRYINSSLRDIRKNSDSATFDKSQSLMTHFPRLKEALLKQCKPTLWQMLFRTQEYKQKKSARKAILKSMDFLEKTIDKHGNESLFLIRPWAKELSAKINFNFRLNLESPIKKLLNKEVNRFMNNLGSDLKMELEQHPPTTQLKP